MNTVIIIILVLVGLFILWTLSEKYALLINDRWPVLIRHQKVADLQEHINQHWKRGMSKCGMIIESENTDFSIHMYKYYIADPHIFYFLVCNSINKYHPDVKRFAKCFTRFDVKPEIGIHVNRLKCEDKDFVKDKITKNPSKEYADKLAGEIENDRLDICDGLIREIVKTRGLDPDKATFTIHISGLMEPRDRKMYGRCKYNRDIPYGKIYQRWHEYMSEGKLLYWLGRNILYDLKRPFRFIGRLFGGGGGEKQ